MIAQLRDPVTNFMLVHARIAEFLASGELVVDPNPADDVAFLANMRKTNDFMLAKGLPGADPEFNFALEDVPRIRAMTTVLACFTEDDLHRMKNFQSVEGYKNNLVYILEMVMQGRLELEACTSTNDPEYRRNCKRANDLCSLPNPFPPVKPSLKLV